MDLGKAGWLSSLVAEALAAPSPLTPERRQAMQAAGLRSGRAQARATLRRILRETGLLYGTPATLDATSSDTGLAREEVLFGAVIRTFARVALVLAELLEAPPGPRESQLLLLFAVLTGRLQDAGDIERRLAAGAPVPRRLWTRVESALAERAVSISGDPAYGLVLHNGALYVDAQVFGRQAISYFARGKLRMESVQRRLHFAALQKSLLVEVLTALACVERTPSHPARRAILRQIEDLQLPSELESALRGRVKQAFERRPRLTEVVGEVRSRDMRRFIIEQALLASLVDGHRSHNELAFLTELADALSVPRDALKSIELEVAEFYRKNRQVVDVFTLSPGAEVMGEELLENITTTAQRNFQRLMIEVRETGELSLLLTKAARGHKLTADERKKMRAQLIDVAKAIPALAIFAAPGGLLLLIALAKVLPFNILPSAFQDPPPARPQPAGPETPPPTQAESGPERRRAAR